MDDSNDSPPPAKRPKRTDENGQHYGNENGSGTSQFARCTRNKVLCEVCSKPDCGKCPNCLLNGASGRQVCRNKPIDKCLSYIKMEKSSKEKTQTCASATTTTHVVSRRNANGDLVSSHAANTEDKIGSDTDPQFILKYVSSQLSSLSSKFSDEINKLKGIVDKALGNSTLSSYVTSTTTGTITSVTSISPSHQEISQYERAFTSSAASASDMHQKGIVCRSSIADIQHMSVSVISQQQNAFYSTNANALTTKCIQTSSVPVLSSVVTIPACSTPDSTSACARHVPASTVAMSSCALYDKGLLNGTSLMSSLQPGFIETVHASTSAAGPTSLSTCARPVSTTTSSRLTSESTGTRPVSVTTSSKLTSGSTGTRPVSTTTSSRLTSESTGTTRPVSTTTSSRLTSGSTGTRPASTASSSRLTSESNGTSPVSTTASSRLTSGSTGTRPFSTTTSSRIPSGTAGTRPVSTTTSSRITSAASGTRPFSTTTSSRLTSGSTDINSASSIGSGRITASTGFSMPTSISFQSAYAVSIAGPVATSTVTTPVCASTISRPIVSSSSRSHSGLTNSRPVQFSTAAPFVMLTTQPIQLQTPVPQHLQTITPQASLTRTPVSSPTTPLCLASPTAALSLTSPTVFRSQSSSSTNQCSPSTSAVNDFLTPCSSPTVEDITETKVMQIMKEAFSSITVDLHVTKCGISGPPGTGKTHIKALLLNQPRPTQRSSTALSTRAEEVTTAEFLVNSVEMRGSLRWTVLQKDHWARLLANTIYNSTPPIDSSHQSSSRVEYNMAAAPIRDVSGMTYKLLLEMYRENKPKRKRSTMNKIHLIYFVDTGGQPQFQEILPNFVRSSINFLVHKLSEKLDDCPGFEYWLNGNKYTIPEALRVSNMSIITQSVRSVCSSIRSEQCDQRSPTVAILGTFKDELKAQCGGDRVSMEDIIKNKGNSIERQLQNYVGQGARKCTLMKCTRESCIFPVDASEEGWEPNSEVIKNLRNEVHTYSDKVQLKGISLSYFVLLQKLKEFSRKKHEPFLDKSTLEQVIKQSHISLGAAQVEEALKLFADVNLILYFPSSRMLKNLIFVDPNFLYERVTEIIVASFDRFGSCTTDNNFKNTGIITDLLLDGIPSLSFTEYPSLTRQMFLSLLQDIFIIAEHKRGHYFIPCVLKLENLESLSPEIKNSMDDIKMYMNYNDVSGPLIISFGDKISPRGLFCAMVAKLSRNFGWRLNECSNAVRCRNMIEFCVCNNKNNVVSPPLGTALLCDKLTHLEVYTTCEKVHCCNIRKAVLSSLYAAGSSLKYSFTAIDVHAGFYCNTCPVGSPKHHTTVSQREDSGVWQEKCSMNTRKRAVPLDSQQDVWFENPSPTVSTENYSRVESIPSVQQVIAELIPNTNKWFVIAVDLEIDLTEIERIRQDKDNETQRFIAVVEKWQKNGRPPFTWSTVVQVLTSQIVQEHSLADNIQKKYLLL